MHRWTPVSSTVPSWSTSTSQEVFHVDTNLPANQEFLICTLVDRAPKAFFGNPNQGSSWLSCLSLNPALCCSSCSGLLTMGRFKLCSTVPTNAD